MSGKTSSAPTGFKAGANVRISDGRTGTLVKQAKDTHVPAWYIKGIIGAVPTEAITLVGTEVQS